MKKQELYLYIGLFICAIIVSSLATVYIAKTQSSSANERSGASGQGINSNTTSYGVFAGHQACIEAIHKAASGKVITLESDDRTAKYQGYNDSNQITFIAEVKPPQMPFLSEQRSTVHVSFKCTTSAKTNEVLGLSQQSNDLHGIQ